MSIGEKQRDDLAVIPFISFQYKVEKSEDEAYQRTKIYYGAEFLFHDGLNQIFHFFNGHIVDLVFYHHSKIQLFKKLVDIVVNGAAVDFSCHFSKARFIYFYKFKQFKTAFFAEIGDLVLNDRLYTLHSVAVDH